jgi:aryl-alcohol dehydrogenase-like predicted oxidoreductase
LHGLKNEGLVGHVGITGLPLDKLRFIVENSDPGMVETILSFCHYSLNDDSLVDELGLYEDRGIGIINASPLSMGLLSERGAPEWHPASEEIIEACKKAADHCKSQNYRIEQLAVKFAVSNHRIATTLVSTANPDNIMKNIRWTEEELNYGLLQEILEILRPVHRKTWENS